MEPLAPDFRTQLFEQFSRICKALGNAHRFELLFLLVNGEHSVERLVHETGMTFANTSQHLQNLKRSGLIISRRARATPSSTGWLTPPSCSCCRPPAAQPNHGWPKWTGCWISLMPPAKLFRR